MSKIVKVEKPIILKFEDREIKLPIELKENIERFWMNAVNILAKQEMLMVF